MKKSQRFKEVLEPGENHKEIEIPLIATVASLKGSKS